MTWHSNPVAVPDSLPQRDHPLRHWSSFRCCCWPNPPTFLHPLLPHSASYSQRGTTDRDKMTIDQERPEFHAWKPRPLQLILMKSFLTGSWTGAYYSIAAAAGDSRCSPSTSQSVPQSRCHLNRYRNPRSSKR